MTLKPVTGSESAVFGLGAPGCGDVLPACGDVPAGCDVSAGCGDAPPGCGAVLSGCGTVRLDGDDEPPTELVGAGVDVGGVVADVVAASTTIVPCMNGWMLQ